MSLRVRDGRILCAAKYEAMPGDVYLDDALHYALAVDVGVLVTEPMDQGTRGGHRAHGEWWWRGAVPADVTIESGTGA